MVDTRTDWKVAGLTISVKIMPNAAKSSEPHLVVAIVYDRLCTFEFGIATEIFGLERPEMGPDWYRFAVCAAEPGPLRATGFRLLADGGPELIEKAGTIIVPGWRGADEPVPESLLNALRKAHERGARILSLCSGIFVLAQAGLLNGRRATTHWRYAERFAARYPDIRLDPHILYVDEGDVLTSAGSAAAIDLCLHLVRRDFGAAAANMVARRLVVPPHRDGGQAQYVEHPVPSPYEASRLSPLIERMRTRLGEEQPIRLLAQEAGMSERTFIRRFRAATGLPPGEWLLKQRIGLARTLLESGAEPVETVAAACGFGSPAALRHHFRDRLGTSPAAYRRRFGQEADSERQAQRQ